MPCGGAAGPTGLVGGPRAGGGEDDADDGVGDRYARFILEAVCDEYEHIERDGACYVRLLKRAG